MRDDEGIVPYTVIPIVTVYNFFCGCFYQCGTMRASSPTPIFVVLSHITANVGL
jgi:hypothetical protein